MVRVCLRLATFTAKDLMEYGAFVCYAVVMSLFALERVKLKEKVRRREFCRDVVLMSVSVSVFLSGLLLLPRGGL